MRHTGEMKGVLLIAVLAIFVAVAAPLALYSWHVLTELLSGRAEIRSIVIAGGCGALFAALAVSFGFWVGWMESAR